MNRYALGQSVRVKTATPFTGIDGAVMDPTTVTLKIEKPDGTETTYTYAAAEITRVAAGDYYRVVNADQAGTWTYRWIGTVLTQSVTDEDQFYVLPSAFS